MNNNLCKGHISKYSDILFFFSYATFFYHILGFWGIRASTDEFEETQIRP